MVLTKLPQVDPRCMCLRKQQNTISEALLNVVKTSVLSTRETLQSQRKGNRLRFEAAVRPVSVNKLTMANGTRKIIQYRIRLGIRYSP
ncbi:MAG TPA: hypothetical protein DEF45_22840 [Rhodopirellula sp.]|nr:hypothetical protein [Rhodopirellula sp.]